MMPVTSHVYRRDPADEANDSLSALASLIRPGSRVLDLGMGAGSLGQRLRAKGPRPPHFLHGLTLNPEEAALAKPSYDAVFVSDLDQEPLHTLPLLDGYDYIVCADVLEHLKYPEQVLSQCERLLVPGGQILLSVPNVAYTGLIAELMDGHFQYRPEGLLDSTHLRFFTRSSLSKWLQEQGWAAALHQCIRKPVHESEFRVAFDTLPPAVSQYLLTLPDGDTYQFIVQAWPSAKPSPLDAWVPLQEPSGELRSQKPWFTSQLYLATQAGYDEGSKQVAGAPMGQGPQWLVFQIPPSPDDYTQVRWDPTDRMGLMRVLQLELADADGTTLWEWNAQRHSSAYLGEWGSDHVLPVPQPGELLLALTGNDPQLVLPLSPQMLMALTARGGALRVKASWPMSADAMALIQHGRLPVGSGAGAGEAESERLEHVLPEIRQPLLHTQRSLAAKPACLERIVHSTVHKLVRPFVAFKMHLKKNQAEQAVSTPASAPLRLTPMHPVDVIVPVYGGLADTQRCLLSVLHSPWAGSPKNRSGVNLTVHGAAVAARRTGCGSRSLRKSRSSGS